MRGVTHTGCRGVFVGELSVPSVAATGVTHSTVHVLVGGDFCTGIMFSSGLLMVVRFAVAGILQLVSDSSRVVVATGGLFRLPATGVECGEVEVVVGGVLLSWHL